MSENTTPNDAMNYFSKIIGQDRAKTRLAQSIQSSVNGGEMISPLIIAEAGVGKTAVMSAYCKGLEASGVTCMFFNSPEEFRERDLKFNQLVELIQSPGKIGIFIDEAHLINYKKTRQSDLIRAFVMKCMDGNNQGKLVALNDEISFVPDRSRIVICLATNFPNILDASGALQSRFDKMDLDLYSKGELVEILQLMLNARGFRHTDENTLSLIANCGRGTARPMEKIIDQLVISRNAVDPDKKTVNRAEVIKALQLVQYFPQGLTIDELRIIQLAGRKPMRTIDIQACLPKLDSNGIKKSVAYLVSNMQFVESTSKGIVQTNRGKNYLSALKSENFVF